LFNFFCILFFWGWSFGMSLVMCNVMFTFSKYRTFEIDIRLSFSSEVKEWSQTSSSHDTELILYCWSIYRLLVWSPLTFVLLLEYYLIGWFCKLRTFIVLATICSTKNLNCYEANLMNAPFRCYTKRYVKVNSVYYQSTIYDLINTISDLSTIDE
jgi:hypothetical protein